MQQHLASEYLDHRSANVSFVVIKPVCWPQLGALSGICSGFSLGILISSILKVVITKKHPSGGTKATKQPYKLNRTLLVAISLPWVVNHSVCHREVYVVCAQSATTSKLWEGAERGGAGRVLSPFSDSRSTSKDPAYNIRCRHFVCLTGRGSQKVLVEALSRWEQLISSLKTSDP